MPNYLALDIGKRRTGIAFASGDTGVPVALESLEHKKSDDLIDHVRSLAEEKSVDLILCGLPLLLSGDEGAQSSYSRSIADALAESGLNVTFLDERYTTPNIAEIDGDAAAACQLLLTFLEREKRSR